jgi:formyl-CoA transferase
VAGSGDHATAVSLYSAIVTALYRRERTGEGSYVTTSLLASGVWATAVAIQGALVDATFYPLHDRLNPPNATLNVYKSQDDSWFVIVLTPDKWPALAKGIGRPDLLTDARFATPAQIVANSKALTAILDDALGSQPIAHWREVFEQGHITYGAVRAPLEVVSDPQLRANDIVVPLEGAGGKLQLTISSPLKVHGIDKVPARRAPEIGEHNDEVLRDIGFAAGEIDGFRTSGVTPAGTHARAATR